MKNKDLARQLAREVFRFLPNRLVTQPPLPSFPHLRCHHEEELLSLHLFLLRRPQKGKPLFPLVLGYPLLVLEFLLRPLLRALLLSRRRQDSIRISSYAKN